MFRLAGVGAGVRRRGRRRLYETMISLRLPRDLINAINYASHVSGKPRSEIIREAIKRYIHDIIIESF